MILDERRSRILRALRSDGAASVRDLAAQLSVSESTIRRDLQLLDRNGELTRTYGGAVLQPRATVPAPGDGPMTEISYEGQAANNAALKAAMAKKAAGLVPDDSVVLLDIGTTTPLVARELRGRPVTVITSNLAVIDELRHDDTVRVVMLGGVLRRNYRTLVGSLTEQALAQVNADLLLLTCTGVRDNGRVVDDMAVEAPIKKAMIDAAERVVLLASASKFPGTGSLRLCSVEDLDVLVTTPGANPQTLRSCRDAGGKVVIA